MEGDLFTLHGPQGADLLCFPPANIRCLNLRPVRGFGREASRLGIILPRIRDLLNIAFGGSKLRERLLQARVAPVLSMAVATSFAFLAASCKAWATVRAGFETLSINATDKIDVRLAICKPLCFAHFRKQFIPIQAHELCHGPSDYAFDVGSIVAPLPGSEPLSLRPWNLRGKKSRAAASKVTRSSSSSASRTSSGIKSPASSR